MNLNLSLKSVLKRCYLALCYHFPMSLFKVVNFASILQGTGIYGVGINSQVFVL